jgi:adenosine deaminase
MKYIELHLHLDGAIRLNTLYEIAKKNNKYILKDEFSEQVSIGKKKNFKSLTQCLKVFKNILKLIEGNKEYLERIAFEICEDQYNNNVIYTELRYNPHILKGNLSLDEVILSINNGIKRGKEKYNIHMNCILCCLRSKPEYSMDIAKLCIKYRDNGIVGIDLAGDEHNYSDELHRVAFDFAHQHEINITVHAGECGNFENIYSALNNLHAKRIGHCYASVKNIKLLQYLKKNNIHIECCYTSSLMTKSVGKQHIHPIQKFHNYNLNYSINTDDPSIFNTNIKKEMKIIKRKLNLNPNDIKQIIINSINSSFASYEQKQIFLKNTNSSF